jgi:hypothetical protein
VRRRRAFLTISKGGGGCGCVCSSIKWVGVSVERAKNNNQPTTITQPNQHNHNQPNNTTPGRRPLHHRGQPARVAHRALRRQGRRPPDRQVCVLTHERQDVSGHWLYRGAQAGARLGQGGGAAVLQVPGRRHAAGALDGGGGLGSIFGAVFGARAFYAHNARLSLESVSAASLPSPPPLSHALNPSYHTYQHPSLPFPKQIKPKPKT